MYVDANERRLKSGGLLIIKSCTDLICSLLTFKQLIISNPMTHLPLK